MPWLDNKVRENKGMKIKENHEDKNGVQ